MAAMTWKNTRFELLDPRTLLTDRNSRTIVDIEQDNPDLYRSVREHGVSIPVIANPTPEGGIRVRDGHSRTIIARSMVEKFPVIPVLVTESEDVAEWQVLRDHWLANEVRSGYTTADRIKLFEQLTLFGLSTEDIATQLSIVPEVVEAGLKARRSKAVTATLSELPQLSLEQAAGLADFEDEPDAYDELMTILSAEPEAFDNELAEWRLRLELREACEQLSRELKASGVVVVGEVLPVGARRLDRLHRSREDRTPLNDDPAAHSSCPGHAAIVTSNNVEGVATPVFVCRDWEQHGHVDSWSPTGTGLVKEEWTPEKSAERARVVRNNKAWRAAETVRRRKLAELLQRKTPPRLAAQFLAHSLTTGGHELRRGMETQHRFARTLLGLKEPKRDKPDPLVAGLGKANVNQATMVSLAVVLAAFEASTSVETWRNPTREQKRYFAALADWGIRLHWVERLVNDPSADADVGTDTELDADIGPVEDLKQAS
ncbi:ParB/Srx family N-terminal domain-containing protein [Saccharothrix sp. NPDC042600]|uniref:ParB/Srx family N-terminal domain-containing protein n=1 Tax=Saccharothrix TaxID=2071 RepID=UPI0033C4D8DB|nr:hypothetical protein GCM10017745_67470 [Saccharothrix mutabilis subsp. capreolus]